MRVAGQLWSLNTLKLYARCCWCCTLRYTHTHPAPLPLLPLPPRYPTPHKAVLLDSLTPVLRWCSRCSTAVLCTTLPKPHLNLGRIYQTRYGHYRWWLLQKWLFESNIIHSRASSLWHLCKNEQPKYPAWQPQFSGF